MRIKFIEKPYGLNLTNGKVYEVLDIDEYGSYVIMNDKNEKQAYFQRRFVVIEI